MLHMVSYQLKPERVAENERLATAVYAALREARPPGLRYATFRLEDGVSFMHVVADSGERSALTALPAFQDFIAGIQERCVTPPKRVALSEIGSHDFFAA